MQCVLKYLKKTLSEQTTCLYCSGYSIIRQSVGRKIVSDYRASLSEVTLSIVLYGDCTSEDGRSRENVRLYCGGLSVAASKHLHSESD